PAWRSSDSIISVSWCGRLLRDVGVIVVAEGSGSRIGGMPKQYRPLAGGPMVLRALRPFTSAAQAGKGVPGVPPGQSAPPPDFLGGLAGDMLSLVGGGDERTDSVAAGLAALGTDCTVVLVHDAARPFVEPAVIDAVIREARTGVGAIAAVPVTDTIKEVADGDDRRIVRTVPRERLWPAPAPP